MALRDPLTHRLIRVLRRLFIIFFIANFLFAVAIVLLRTLQPNNGSHQEQDAEQRWIASSSSWLDRAACTWINSCGGTNWLGQTWLFRKTSPKTWPSGSWQSTVNSNDWLDLDAKSLDQWDEEELVKRNIPQCVLDYAPLIYLHPDEPYWIADPAEHLKHTYAQLNGERVDTDVNLANLSLLNEYMGGEGVCLTSIDDIDEQPPWMISNWTIPVTYPERQVPSLPGFAHLFSTDPNEVAKKEGWYQADPISIPSKATPYFRYTNWTNLLPSANITTSGYSSAPAVLITTPKANNTLDAFWFIFNSFNLGNRVLGMRFGNHIGDWEHVMIRFQNCEPKALFTSRHSFGDSAYSFDALEKIGNRPVVYSARGSHAMYVTEGIQPYKLPFKMLYDSTARGPLWDPALNGLKAYTYDILEDNLRASSISPRAATSWFHFRDRWGDERYPLGDHRQYRFVGEHHYSTGPTGPKFKALNRQTPCENERNGCLIKISLP